LVKAFVKDKLQTELNPFDIYRSHRLGKGKNRPIIVKFAFHKRKEEILKNAYRVKGTPVRISEDISFAVRTIRRELNGYRIQAKERGQRARLQLDKLYIDGKIT